MSTKTCSVCDFTYVSTLKEDIKKHRSHHNRYLFINRKYGPDVYRPADLLNMRDEALRMLENDPYQAGEILTRVELTKYVWRTKNYLSFEEFLQTKVPGEILDQCVAEAILFYRHDRRLFLNIMKKRHR